MLIIYFRNYRIYATDFADDAIRPHFHVGAYTAYLARHLGRLRLLRPRLSDGSSSHT